RQVEDEPDWFLAPPWQHSKPEMPRLVLVRKEEPARTRVPSSSRSAHRVEGAASVGGQERTRKGWGSEMRRGVSCRVGLLTVALMGAGLLAGPAAGAALPVTERLPFGAVEQVWTDVVHQFADGPGCDGTGDAGGRFNVIH